MLTYRIFSSVLVVAALAFVAACDDGGGDGATDTAADGADALGSDSSDDALTSDTAPQDTAQPGDFACGASLTCGSGEGCAGLGQGACVGPEPDENGHCAPDCYAYECGGGPTCLCDTYWCVALPSGCDACSCATAPYPSCLCEDTDGHVVFACPGA